MVKRRPQTQSSQSEADNTLDVERQLPHSRNDREPSSSTQRARNIGVASGSHGVPFRSLLRKIAAVVLTDLDDETLQREGTDRILIAITIIKEAIYGISISICFTLFVLLLDNLLGLRLPTARNFRKAAVALLTDQETLQGLEESTSLKVMLMDDYEHMVHEIKSVHTKTMITEEVIQKSLKQIEEMKQELDASLFPEKFHLLNLNNFCEQCIWGQGKQTCIQRVQSLKASYQTPKFKAMLLAMEKPSCRKSAKKVEGEKKQKLLVDVVLNNWTEAEKKFCGVCDWDNTMSCDERVVFLNERYGTFYNTAKAQLMVESEVCKISFFEAENKKLSRLCAKCEWGNETTCQQMVDYLLLSYKTPNRKEMVYMMEKPGCVLPKKLSKYMSNLI